jgi:predicted MPP superfamily phosphohydrolase
VNLLKSAGFKLLRGESAEVAPGLVLVGVDDLTAQEQAGLGADGLSRALSNRPPGATILLSHTPIRLPADLRGVNLVLSGHTHNGQIWPFNYLVKLRYPWVGGRYQAGGVTAIVCRGTGTWGPRMRLWRPSELVRITLRSTPGASPVSSPSLASE